MKRCLLKLRAKLRDFDTSEVTAAADDFRSRGADDRSANVAAVEAHLADLRAQRAQIDAEAVAQWQGLDPAGHAAALAARPPGAPAEAQGAQDRGALEELEFSAKPRAEMSREEYRAFRREYDKLAFGVEETTDDTEHDRQHLDFMESALEGGEAVPPEAYLSHPEIDAKEYPLLAEKQKEAVGSEGDPDAEAQSDLDFTGEARRAKEGTGAPKDRPLAFKWHQDPRGMPVLTNDVISLARARKSETQPASAAESRYAFDIVDTRAFKKALADGLSVPRARAKATVGEVLLDFEGKIVRRFWNVQVHDKHQGKGHGRNLVVSLLESQPDGEPMRLMDIKKPAVGFWVKMGAKFPRSDDYMESVFSVWDYREAKRRRGNDTRPEADRGNDPQREDGDGAQPAEGVAPPVGGKEAGSTPPWRQAPRGGRKGAREPVERPAKKAKATKPPPADSGVAASEGQLKDFGEKIGGARKDRWVDRGLSVEDLDGMSGGEGSQYATKDNVWPKIDYAAMIAAGTEPPAAAFVKVMRDRLAAKPRKDTPEGRKAYVEAMGAARDVLSKVKTVEDVKGAGDRVMRALGVVDVRNPRGSREALEKFWTLFKGRANPFGADYYDARRVTELLAADWPVKKSREGGTTGDGDKKAEPVRPHLDKVQRSGADVREGRAITAKEFSETFGFRGIEFGNWAANDERQRILNMAFEALHDMATLIGVPPKAMSLNGTLGLALAARGGGKFAAHYEPGKLVINITKLRGAGSLAHEWGHALDHYFGELDQPNAYQGGARGASGWYTQDDYSGTPRQRMEKVDGRWKSVDQKGRLANLRPEVAGAFDDVMRALFKETTTKAELVRDAELRLERLQAQIPAETNREKQDGLARAAQAQGQALVEMKRDMGEIPRVSTGRKSSYYSQALKLSGKSGATGYWARPTEMFARAFESYVFDRIHADDRVSDYLVHGVEPGRYAGAAYKGNPYPEGVEREAIGEAFDKLFKVIETKETEKGVALYKKAEATAKPGLLRAAVLRAIEPVRAAWANGPEVEVHDGPADVPGIAEDAAGAFYDGKVHLFASNLHSSADVVRVFLHEGVGHYGLLGVLGPKLHGTMFTIYRTNEAVRDLADRWMASNPQEAGQTHEQYVALASEEALADLAGTGLIREQGFWRWLVSTIRSALRTAGLNIEVTDDEIVSLLASAKRHVEAGASQFVGGRLQPAFHKAYHGTPHDFDAFTTEAIGTGEGNQTYGWGLYFAGNKEVAQHYRDALSRGNIPHFAKDGRELQSVSEIAEAYYQPGRIVPSYGGQDRVLAFQRADDSHDWSVKVQAVTRDGQPDSRERPRWHTTFPGIPVLKSAMRADGYTVKSGSLFEVELAPKEDQYLDWDKKLSEQSDAIKALIASDPELSKVAAASAEYSGRDAYQILSGTRGDSQFLKALRARGLGHYEEASRYLAGIGIPGIKYLDGSSRRGAAFGGGKVTYEVKKVDEKKWAGVKLGQNTGPQHTYFDTEAEAQAWVDKQQGGHHNYVIFDEKHVAVQAKYSRAVTGFPQGWSAEREENGSYTLMGPRGEALPSYATEGDAAHAARQLVAESGPRLATRDGAKLSRQPLDIGTIAPALRDKLADVMKSQKQFNWWHRTIGTQYHKATTNREYRPVFEAAQRFVQDVSLIATEAADLAPAILPKLASVLETAKDFIDVKGTRDHQKDLKAIGAPVFKGTLQDNKVYTDAELRKDFKLSDRQVALYRQFRAAVDRSLDMLAISEMTQQVQSFGIPHTLDAAKAAASPIEALGIIRQTLQDIARSAPVAMQHEIGKQLAALENVVDRVQKLKEEGYAPLMRFGRHFVYLYKQNKAGERQTVYFSLHDSEREANADARRVAELFADDKAVKQEAGILSEESYKTFKGVSPETLELFADALGVEGDAAKQAFLRLAVAQRSALKRLIHRKGVVGFSDDVSRTLASFITSNARLASRNHHLGELKARVEDIRAGDVKDDAVKLMKYLEDPQEEAAAFRGLLFIQYLGGSLAAAMVNATQPVTMSAPYLNQFANLAEVGKQLTRGAAVALGKDTGDAELTAALKRAGEEGVTEPAEIHQLYAESIRGFGSNIFVRRFLRLWGSAFQRAEEFNRKTTFVAAFEIGRTMDGAALKEHGTDNAFDFAVKAVHETQGIYNRANRPNWARGVVGSTIFTFKQFSISYLEFLKRLPPKQRALALGVLVLAAGVQGLPGAEDLEDIVDSFAESLGYNFSSERAMHKFIAESLGLGEGAARWVMYGSSTLPGMPLDVQTRMGLGNLVPGTSLLRKSQGDKSREALEVFGPAGGLIKSGIEAFGALQAGNPGEAIAKGAPVAIQNLLKAIDMADKGAYRDARGRRVIETGPMDAATKAIGFQPSDVAGEQRAVARAMQPIQLTRMVEADIAGKWAEGVFERDPKKVLAAREKLAEWNAKNPETPIRVEQSQIRSRVKEMSMTRSQRAVKAAPRETRGVIANELRQ